MTSDEWTQWLSLSQELTRARGHEAATGRVHDLFDAYPSMDLAPEPRERVLGYLSLWFEYIEEDLPRLVAVNEDRLRHIDEDIPHPVERANVLVAIADSFAEAGRRDEAKKVYRQALEVSEEWGVFRAFELEDVWAKMDRLSRGDAPPGE